MLDHSTRAQQVSDLAATVKPAIDFAALGTILGAIAGYVPAVAALVAMLWYIILIYESETLKHWRAERAYRKLDKLKAQERKLLDHIAAGKDPHTPEDRSDPA